MDPPEQPTNPLTLAPTPAPTPILPHYPELILAAIEACDIKKTGANKSKISKQIEASYSNIPAAHKTLLSHHLNKMRASGELIVKQNNYIKNDPNSPPPRGRGRPRKVEDPLNPVVKASSSGRKRGRPRKEPGDGWTLKKLTSGEKRGRGRPKKARLTDENGMEIDRAAVSGSGVKKGRGRPRKVRMDGEVERERAVVTISGVKKGRGRPRKHKKMSATVAMPGSGSGEKRGRGRPRKVRMEGELEPIMTPVSASGEKRGRGRPPKVKTLALVEV